MEHNEKCKQTKEVKENLLQYMEPWRSVSNEVSEKLEEVFSVAELKISLKEHSSSTSFDQALRSVKSAFPSD